MDSKEAKQEVERQTTLARFSPFCAYGEGVDIFVVHSENINARQEFYLLWNFLHLVSFISHPPSLLLYFRRGESPALNLEGNRSFRGNAALSGSDGSFE